MRLHPRTGAGPADEALLSKFAEHFTGCLGSQIPASGWVFYVVAPGLRIDRFVGARTDSAQQSAYLQYFNRLDPLSPSACLPRQRFVVSLQQALSPNSHQHREYQRHFMQRYGIVDALEIFMRAGSDRFVGCSLLRDVSMPIYSPQELLVSEQLRVFAEFALAEMGPRGLPDEAFVAKRFPQLTPREVCMVCRVSEGLGNKEICRREGLALATVKSHLQSVFRKLEVRSRAELATLLH